MFFQIIQAMNFLLEIQKALFILRKHTSNIFAARMCVMKTFRDFQGFYNEPLILNVTC